VGLLVTVPPQMPPIPRVLLVDDDADDRALTSLILGGAFRDVQIHPVDNAAALYRALLSRTFGLVITEYRLSWIDGVEVVSLVREVCPDCPVVFLTRINPDEVIEEALLLSVDGFVAKSATGLAHLPETIRHSLKRAERQVVEAAGDGAYQRFVDEMAVGAFIASSTGYLIDANPSLATMLDYADTSILMQQNVASLFVQESDAEAWRSWLTSTEGTIDMLTMLRRADDTSCRARLRVWSLKDDNSETIQIHGLVERAGVPGDQHDVQTQESGEASTSDKDLEQIISAVSHDLQQPLVQVARYLELLEQQDGDTLSDDGRRFLSHARGGAHRLQDMVAAALRYSRIDTRGGSFAPVDLGLVIERVSSLLSDAIQEFDVDMVVDGLPTITADEMQMEQLFQNLIGNAIKFRGDAPPQIRVFAEENAASWLISVQDNGIGIAPEAHERIFKMFQRLHSESEYPGTGIGLAMCRRIAARHGGSISVASALGRGATFTLILPKHKVAQ
jgi:signal transduction histidine kinase